MVYSVEEKRKMDDLVRAFGDYIARNTDIDIAYSDKTGYVRLIIAECADAVYFTIPDYDTMLHMFIDDIFCDELERDGCTENNTPNFPRAYRYLRTVLKNQPDAMNTMEAYWNEKINSRHIK